MFHTRQRGVRSRISHGQGDKKEIFSECFWTSKSNNYRTALEGHVTVSVTLGKSLPNPEPQFLQENRMVKGFSRLPLVQKNSRDPATPISCGSKTGDRPVRQRDLGRGSFLELESQHPLLRSAPRTLSNCGTVTSVGLSSGWELLLLKQLSQCIAYNSYKTWFS